MPVFPESLAGPRLAANLLGQIVIDIAHGPVEVAAADALRAGLRRAATLADDDEGRIASYRFAESFARGGGTIVPTASAQAIFYLTPSRIALLVPNADAARLLGPAQRRAMYRRGYEVPTVPEPYRSYSASAGPVATSEVAAFHRGFAQPFTQIAASYVAATRALLAAASRSQQRDEIRAALLDGMTNRDAPVLVRTLR